VVFTLDGVEVRGDADASLLHVLRAAGATSVKDGCSPQGQCGCCTVWVDGQPRVSCVTPAARVAGRDVTTLDGLPDADEWARRLCDSGGSQCGFCTPGIIMRLAAIPVAQRTDASVRQALLAHLCRCTGWQTIVEGALAPHRPAEGWARHPGAAAERAELEGGVPQRVSPAVASGHGGFAADTAPADALVAVRGVDGGWVVAESHAAALRMSGKVQGRRTTESLRWPLEVPEGDWVRTLQTTWVEPAYLEPDAAWCGPGGEPVGPLGNGGAFGGKAGSGIAEVARQLALEHGRTVLALYSREDVVRLGPKRPPVAAGVRADGTGVMRVVRTPGIADAIRSVAPGLEVQEVDVPGPPTSTAIRAAGWAEAVVLLAPDDGWVTDPHGGRATAVIDADGAVHVTVQCGAVIDEGVVRSYCVGAAHMALGWVRREAIAVDEHGAPLDLTIRSFGVLRATETPPVHIHIVTDGRSVNGSDAVFAAVALAAWRASGFAPRWPTMRT
jgi:aerobic-type carbon monoxide dehydrogenase small subunit (CoxS/CutS family)